jgi:hypothetical protein
LSAAGSAAKAATVAVRDRRGPATLWLCDLAVAFFFRDRFVFDFLTPGLERFVVSLFALAMAMILTLNNLYAGVIFPVLFGMRRQREHARMIRKTEKGKRP